jgi:hypothetical protein
MTPADKKVLLEDFRRQIGNLYLDIEFTLGSDDARRLFLEAITPKGTVRKYRNAEIMARYLESGKSLLKFAGVIATERKQDVNTVYTQLTRTKKRMMQDAGFRKCIAECADFYGYEIQGTWVYKNGRQPKL